MRAISDTIRTSLLLLLVCSVCFVHAQQRYYVPLRNSGPVPEEFFPGKLKNVELSDVSENASRKERKLFTDFKLEGDFFLYQQLTSGNVLYATPVNDYVNAVADRLLENDPALRKKLRIFIMQSSTVNAFTYSNGMIFICTGLLAHLDNEAELASVLSHEIGHFIKGHSFRIYKQKDVISKNTNVQDEYELDRAMLAINHFSREQETEADEVGFQLLLKSAYDPRQAVNVFDMLAHADFPYDSVPLRKSFSSRYRRESS